VTAARATTLYDASRELFKNATKTHFDEIGE
jgi:hypothetical protein